MRRARRVRAQARMRGEQWQVPELPALSGRARGCQPLERHRQAVAAPRAKPATAATTTAAASTAAATAASEQWQGGRGDGVSC